MTFNGLQTSFYSGFPTLLVNPAFLSLIMIVLTGGDYVLSRYLKSRFQNELHPVTLPSDYRKVTLDLSEILYVESRDTEVWVCATDGRKFRNKTGITQWENLLGEDFIRVHRSFVVRKESIQETLSDSLTLADGTYIPVSRKNREIVVSLSDN
jgi:DNA-binding LytR/AlgR family response regulator